MFNFGICETNTQNHDLETEIKLPKNVSFMHFLESIRVTGIQLDMIRKVLSIFRI